MTSPESTIPSAEIARPASARLRAWRLAIYAVLAASIGLAVFAYRDLAQLAAGGNPQAFPKVRGIERFFFVPSAPSYGFIGSIFVWMLVSRVRRLKAALIEPGSVLPAIGLLAASAALFVWGQATSSPSLLVPSLALLLVGGGWLLGGARAAFALLGPALLLYFAWPWPGVLMNRVVWALQMFAVDLATAILSGLGIAYEVSGDQILARQHTFQVIETCSGMRSLETLTIAAIAYCELFGRHGRRLWALVLSAPVIALLLNGVRVVTIILNPYSEVVAIHTLQGLVIIVLGVFAIAGVDSLFERLGWFPGGAPRMLRVPREVPFHAPRWTALAAFLVMLSIASVLPLLASPSAPVVPLMQRIPAVVGEWSSVPAKVDQGFLGSVYYTQMLRRDYKRGDAVITLFAAEDDRQQPAASLLSPKIAIGDTGWDTTDRSRLRVDALELERLVLRRGPAQRQLVYYWLEGERPFGTELARAAFALDRNPRHHSEPIRAARLAIRFDATIPRAEESAEQDLQQFVRELAHAELFAATSP